MCKRKAFPTLWDRRRDRFAGKPLGTSINTTDRSTPYQGVHKFHHLRLLESSRHTTSHAAAPAWTFNCLAPTIRAALAASGRDRRFCKSSIYPGTAYSHLVLVTKGLRERRGVHVTVPVMFCRRENPRLFCSERGLDPRMLSSGRNVSR